MKHLAISLFTLTLLLPISTLAQQEENYDYWQPQRAMVQRGQQAIFMCNGLFTSKRTLEQIFAQELAFFREPIGDADGGDYNIDWNRRAVEIGASGAVPVMRAVFREGIGCVILPPDQTLADIDSLPELTLPLPPGDPARIPWPNGDLVNGGGLPAGVDGVALQAASDWAFDRDSEEQVTLSLIVVYNGEIIHERYAAGFDVSTRTRTWSTAKSIATTLIGMLVDQGRMSLDEPLGFDWYPMNSSAETDPRNQITLRHVLNMSSGLDTIDNRGREYSTGSGLSYW
ncbi:MAG: serine hydrolase, partial [Proteobacteria bacterium]|nr:serine hydrolase [Pseudomonadota bacterium]